MFYLDICLYIMCVPRVHGDQKPALDSLELELQMGESHCVGGGTQTQVFRKNSHHS